MGVMRNITKICMSILVLVGTTTTVSRQFQFDVRPEDVYCVPDYSCCDVLIPLRAYDED